MLLDRQLLLGGTAFVLVVAPWYGLVTLDTKGKWVEAFLLNENVNRFAHPSDGHSGGIYYHVLAVLVLFGPWVVFLPAALWYGAREARNRESEEVTVDAPEKYRFLILWFLCFLVIFSVAATKLPNYLVPAYPAIAILTGRFLDRWRQRLLVPPNWVISEAIAATAFIGLAMTIGMLVTSGTIPLPIKLKGFQRLPALRDSAAIGLIPLAMAIICGWLINLNRRSQAIAVFAVGAVLCLALIGAVPTVELQDYKVPKYFAEHVGLRQTDRDIRIASCRWMRHSIVFYARREVTRIDDYEQVDRFLRVPRPAYVIVPENEWQKLRPHLTTPVREIARKYDFYARRDILVIANRYAAPD